VKSSSLLIILLLLLSVTSFAQEKIKWNKDGAEMVLIPAGSFEMGDHLDNMGNALPVHRVELDAFYMDVNEVTVGQFKQFVAASGYDYDFDEDSGYGGPVARYSPTDEHPMVRVIWDDAVAYAKWAGKRLPTEAEWEYAARGGLNGKRYPWGNDITHDHANHIGIRGKDKWVQSTAPVGSFEPNGYGLYDMAGNVWEWCADWYDEDYYSKSPLRNPQGPGTGTRCVLRGGSWFNGINALRVAYRNFNSPSDGNNLSLGFRCVSGF
tara:strand:+ start:69 stop:863 length:795 start_codon:yes stop_codon:yes gene_type:complete